MENQSKVIPVELLEKVAAGAGGDEGTRGVDVDESITDDAQDDLPDRKQKRLGDLSGEGN